MSTPTDTIAVLKAKFSPERLAAAIAKLPPAAQARVQRLTAPKPTKTILRIRHR